MQYQLATFPSVSQYLPGAQFVFVTQRPQAVCEPPIN